MLSSNLSWLEKTNWWLPFLCLSSERVEVGGRLACVQCFLYLLLALLQYCVCWEMLEPCGSVFLIFVANGIRFWLFCHLSKAVNKLKSFNCFLLYLSFPTLTLFYFIWMQEDLAQMGVMIRHYNSKELKGYVRVSVGKPEHTQALMKCLWRLS